MSRKKHYKEPEEEHADETWLVPYSDILTLLLALFIVLFASSQVDQKKFEQMAQSFNSAFSGNTSIFESSRTKPNVSEPLKPPTLEKLSSVISKSSDTREKEYLNETVQLIEVKRILDKYIADNNLTGQLETKLSDDGLMIVIKDTALFPSGNAALLPESRRFASEIAKMLTQLTQRVVISGHTDNVPINNWEFPTNWDLSSKRALNFMKFLLDQEKGLQPVRFSATGYGEYHPVMPNDTDEGRAKNRRVEVLIARNVKL